MDELKEELEKVLSVNGLYTGPLYNALWAQGIGVNCALVIGYLCELLWKAREPEQTEDGQGYILEISNASLFSQIGLRDEEQRKVWNRMAKEGVIQKLPRINVGMKNIAFYPSRVRGFVHDAGGFWTKREELELEKATR